MENTIAPESMDIVGIEMIAVVSNQTLNRRILVKLKKRVDTGKQELASFHSITRALSTITAFNRIGGKDQHGALLKAYTMELTMDIARKNAPMENVKQKHWIVQSQESPTHGPQSQD